MDQNLTKEHRNYLHNAGITDTVIDAAGIHSTTTGGIKENLSGIVFPYRWEGQEVENFRPDTPITTADGKEIKYLWPEGVAPILTMARQAFGAGPILIVEGTKQALAVAAWAPENFSVVGMNGCYGWVKQDLSWFEDREVFLVFDGDAASNLGVYNAALKLADELDNYESGPVKYIILPVQGKEGADDYLAGIPEDKRTTRITKLVSKAEDKPAKSKPTKSSGTPEETPVPDTDGRIGIAVNLDRRDVINKFIDGLKERADGRELYCFADLLAQVDGDTATPLTQGAMIRMLYNHFRIMHFTEATKSKPAIYTDTEPSGMTISAVMSAAKEFSPLDKIARVPFVRHDGTIVADEGYDRDSRSILVRGTGMDRVTVPDRPTRDDVQRAVEYLLTEWLGDMSFATQADQANCLGLVLTPFIRSLIGVVPLCVINGLQPGVGKNLLADCLAILITGDVAVPLPYSESNDEELKKTITSEMVNAGDFMMLDEAHYIESKQLSRTLTAHIYTDRILGSSKMMRRVNNVTWLSMGNQVQVVGDMFRRVYYVSLSPEGLNPQDRDNDEFRHSDLKDWTRDNRPELVSAALTLVRAWMAAGRPSAKERTKTMGSFEQWDRMISSILEHSGVTGFLSDLPGRRSEGDFFGARWTDHLVWLWQTFGEEPFVIRSVVEKAIEAGADYEAPPGLEDPTDKSYRLKVGQQYSKVKSRWFSHQSMAIRLIKEGLGHGSTLRWRVEVKTEDEVPTSGRGVEVLGGVTSTPHVEKKMPSSVLPAPYMCPPQSQEPKTNTSNTSTHLQAPVSGPDGYPPQSQGAEPITSNTSTPLQTLLEDEDDPRNEGDEDMYDGTRPASMPETLFMEPAVIAKPKKVPAPRPVIEPAQIAPAPPLLTDTTSHIEPVSVPEGAVVGFDIESHSVKNLFIHTRGEYVKLFGLGEKDSVAVTSDVSSLDALKDAGTIVTVNGNLFDMIAIDHHHGIPVEDTIPKSHDLRMVAFQADPPHRLQLKPGPQFKRYSMEALAGRYLADMAKSGAGEELSKEFAPVCAKDKKTGTYTLAYVNGVNQGQSWGSLESLDAKELESLGWGNIPADDPRFVEYCRSDVNVTLALAEKLPMTDYDRREALVASVTARMSLTGFRVDVPAVKARVAELEAQSAAGRTMLAETYAFPSEGAAPQRSNAGKAAFLRALKDFGISTERWPKNKDGSLSLSKETMATAITFAEEKNHPVLPLLEAVQELNGVRNNAANILRHTVGDRVHPKFTPFQATGRWSIQDPGVTVLAKPKKGKFSERAFLLPDPGEVLVAIDYDQVDIRCVAAHSQDPGLLKIVNDPDRDIHSEVSIMTFGDAEPANRTKAKMVDLGWMYRISIGGLVKQGVPQEVAVRVSNAMASQFPTIAQWQEHLKSVAEAGMLLDNGFGRKLRITPGWEYTQTPAYMGQSTTRDVIAQGLLTMREKYPHLLPMLRMIVHDEVVLSVPQDRAVEYADQARSCMDMWWAPKGKDHPVHFTCGKPGDFVFGETWAGCYPVK